MIVIYRGDVFDHNPPADRPYRKPRALNWRFQIPNQTYDDNQIYAPIDSQAHALNWRYQVPR